MTQSKTLREEISKILVKWNMPTRQAAISEIVSLFEQMGKDLIGKDLAIEKPDDLEDHDTAWNMGVNHLKRVQRYKLKELLGKGSK